MTETTSYGVLAYASGVFLVPTQDVAAVLYEPAFVVIATWFPDHGARTRALLTLTVIAGFASVIYVPWPAGWSRPTAGATPSSCSPPC